MQANASLEPDYFSRGAGLALTGDFKEKTITPRLAFNYSLDTIGRRNLDVDTTLLKTAEMELGTTFVLSPTSLVLVSLTGQFRARRSVQALSLHPGLRSEHRPHTSPRGAVIDLVNRYRLPFRPTEQLPTERDRYALGARFAHRFTGINSTFRAEERVYIDDWGLKSTTTDLRFVVDAGKRLRLWPHFRYNVQNGVNFYQLAYSATTNAAGQLQVPLFRTGDRELSPMDTITGGGGVRYALSAPDSKVQWDLTLQGDVMYSQFFDSLYVDDAHRGLRLARARRGVRVMRRSTNLGARFLALAVVAAGLGAAASCSDPVHESEVAALGGETDIPQGEYHRAGQPCGVCHGQEGPARLQFSLAGTVFLGPDCRVGAGGAHVLIIDSEGHQPPGEVVTNCVGNFEIAQDVWAPEFPILAWVQDGDITKKMMSHVSRETACNQCHKDPNSDDAPGHIYMNDVEPTSYTVSCPYSPNVPTNGCNNPVIVNTETTVKSRSAGGETVAADVTGATPSAPPAYIWTSAGSAAVQTGTP